MDIYSEFTAYISTPSAEEFSDSTVRAALAQYTGLEIVIIAPRATSNRKPLLERLAPRAGADIGAAFNGKNYSNEIVDSSEQVMCKAIQYILNRLNPTTTSTSET